MSDNVRSEPAPAFQPTLRAFAYLHAVEAILMADGRLTHDAIGQRMGLKPDALRKWLTRNPEVVAWVREELRSRRDHQKELLFERNLQLGLRGSISHSEWCAKVAGWFEQRDADGAGGGAGFVVNMLIPRPDGTWDLQPEDRPLPVSSQYRSLPQPASQSAPVSVPVVSSPVSRVEAPIAEDPLDRVYRKLQPRASGTGR